MRREGRIEAAGIRGRGIWEENIREGWFEGNCLGFSLTKGSYTVDFTVPPAVALLNKEKV
jgi:hypothetical protein